MTGYESKRAAAQDKLAQPVQEPVAWYHNDFGVVELSRIPRAGWKLLTTPPQRPWVGLTDEDMKKSWYDMENIMGWYSFQEVARAIEAKLKERNA